MRLGLGFDPGHSLEGTDNSEIPQEDASATTSVWTVMTGGGAATVAAAHHKRNIRDNGICWDI